jgi:glycosyltransferase involved in cell wall biosynthesis
VTGRAAPLVSVGMPAYNSARTIAASIDCVLAQDLADLELVISDNGSTDDTWAIVQAYAARDPRVVPLRQASNIGANGNYTAVFRAARGRFFKWASSNDWCAPDFLSRCVQALQANPDAVLVAPRTRLFQHQIADGRDYPDDFAFDAADPVQRFRDVTVKLRLNNVLNGVIRSDVLARTRLIEHYRGADVVLVAHLALLGRILLLDAHLFGRRMDEATATAMMTAEAIERHHYPAKSWRSLFPSMRHAAGCVRAIHATDLPHADRWRAMAWVARLLRWRGPALREDLIDAIRFPLR